MFASLALHLGQLLYLEETRDGPVASVHSLSVFLSLAFRTLFIPGLTEVICPRCCWQLCIRLGFLERALIGSK